MARRRDIAAAEPGIIMARADEPVENDFGEHGYRPTQLIASTLPTPHMRAVSPSIVPPGPAFPKQQRKSPSRPVAHSGPQIGRGNVCTPVHKEPTVSSLLLEQ